MLRQGIGNPDQAMLRLLALGSMSPKGHEPDVLNEQKSEPASPAIRKVGPGVSWDFSRIPIFPPDGAPSTQSRPLFNLLPVRGVLQPKLAIGEVNDPLEREADRVAEQVMRMPDRDVSLGGGPAQIRRKCAACEEDEGKVKNLQAKLDARPKTAAIYAPSIVEETLRSPGQSLDTETRSFFEPRFGHDFSRVRVHVDSKSDMSARSVGALAYTVGSHIAFGASRYAPRTEGGRQLLAHELAHVIQQTQGGATQAVSRAPTKSGVKKSDYSFSTNCGWIDWGHANPGLAKKLIAQVQQASDALKSGGSQLAQPSKTSQMKAARFGVVFSSASMQVTLARPLSDEEVLSVALSMFKSLSIIFEIQQEWTDWFSGSAFSQEDLPSNLISFYRAARGFNPDQIRQFCGALDVNGSLQEFDRNSDFKKNPGFSPIGAPGPWPAELSTIDDTKGASLYSVTNVSVGGPASGFTFCPLYRVEGTIGDTGLIILSFGGATFTAAENVRVVPTYRGDTDRTSLQGHVPFIEIEPYGDSDAAALKAKGVKAPLYVPTSSLTCLGEIEGGDLAGHLRRLPMGSVAKLGRSAAPDVVATALSAPGDKLSDSTRAVMERRFGHDFSRVRVHCDPIAAESANAVGARAYSVGDHVVFATGQYDTSSRAGQFLLAHELAHTIQARGSNPSTSTLRRGPAAAKPQSPNIDQIAQAIGPALGGPYADYAAYAASMIPGNFLGHPIARGVKKEFLAKLQLAETVIDAEYAKAGNSKPAGYGIRSVGGFRFKEGPHGWGLAIDIDSDQNPFVMHEKGSTPAKEAGERKLDRQLVDVYNRIAEFVLNDPITLPPPIGGPHQSIIPVLITKTGYTLSGGKLPRDARWVEYYDRLKKESDAMKRYFALMRGTQEERDNFIKNQWKSTHPGQPGPDYDDIRKVMWEDYAALGGSIPEAGPPDVQDFQKPGTVDPADRPFKGAADPAKGFLTIPREVVQGLGQVLTRWGAIDFGGESGDVMHFDDMQGLGTEIGRAKTEAEAKIAAATNVPTSAVTPQPSAPTSGPTSASTNEASTATVAVDTSKDSTATPVSK